MRHLEVLKRLGEVQPIGVPTRPERLEVLKAAGLSAAIDLKGAARMGARFGVIATDTGRHMEDGLAALELGMDLLVEKPLAADASGARQLCRRAEALNRKLQVGCVLRFSEALNRFRDLLPKMGPVHAVEITCRSFMPDWRRERDYRSSYSARAAEGGVLRDLIHEVDYAGWLFGWPGAVQASLRNLGRLGIEAEETADLFWETPGGALVSIHLDYLTRPHQRRMTAFGEQGTLEWNGTENSVALVRAGREPEETSFSDTREEMFSRQARAFLESGASGGNGFQPARGIDGVMALALCDAARISSRTRNEEKVEQA